MGLSEDEFLKSETEFSCSPKMTLIAALAHPQNRYRRASVRHDEVQ
jgi:hypothetical protein